MAAAASTTVGKTGPTRVGSLPLAGQAVAQGSGSTGYESSVSTFQLQGTSPSIPSCSATLVVNCISVADDRSADLRYVGSASDAQLYDNLSDAFLSFGVSSYGQWRTPAGYTEFDVLLDTNGDHVADALVYNTRVSTTDDYDYFLSELVDLREGSPTKGEVLDDELINGIDGSFDTNVFNSDSLVLPVWVGALKDAGLVTDGSTKVRYWVESYTGAAGKVDTVGSATSPMTLTVGAPGFAAFGDFGTMLNTDAPGQSLDVVRNDGSFASDHPSGLLLLHHLNTNGARAQVVSVKPLIGAASLRISATC
jgi:hypothetical protein